MRQGVIHLIRGLPGSGKSTFANKLGIFHVEADYHFQRANGNYDFYQEELKLAHKICQRLAEGAMIAGWDLAVSNTFCRFWEMMPYVNLAKKYDYRLKIVRLTTQFNSTKLIPDSVIQKMKTEFEEFESEIIISA